MHVKTSNSAILRSVLLSNNTMQQTVPTLLEFASDEMLIDLLIRERAKYRRRNRSDKHHRLDRQCELSELSVRKMLSRMMPPYSN